jgi:hypothetical protein
MKVDMNQVEAPTNLVFPQEASPETKLSASMNRPEADPSTSFTADSPYFKTYVENEIEDLETLKAVLAEISQKAGIFGANARLMIQSMRELAQACRLKCDMEKLDGESEIERKHRELGYLKERRSCLGEDMVAVFKNLGQVRARVLRHKRPLCFAVLVSLLSIGVCDCRCLMNWQNLMTT